MASIKIARERNSLPMPNLSVAEALLHSRFIFSRRDQTKDHATTFLSAEYFLRVAESRAGARLLGVWSLGDAAAGRSPPSSLQALRGRGATLRVLCWCCMAKAFDRLHEGRRTDATELLALHRDELRRPVQRLLEMQPRLFRNEAGDGPGVQRRLFDGDGDRECVAPPIGYADCDAIGALRPHQPRSDAADAAGGIPFRAPRDPCAVCGIRILGAAAAKGGDCVCPECKPRVALLRDALLFATETIGGALVAPPPTPFDVLQAADPRGADDDAEGSSKLVRALRYARENEALLPLCVSPAREKRLVGLAAALVGDRQRTLVGLISPGALAECRAALERAARANALFEPFCSPPLR
jgi:hypothetical protein